MKLIGRNLDASEYGGTPNTHVRLVPADGDKAVVLTPDSLNPYCVDFSVPSGLAPGRYFIEVCTEGAEFAKNWVRLDNRDEYPDAVRDTAIQVESCARQLDGLGLESGVGQ